MWRRGPGGPGTLCNACGVKWKHGKILVGVGQSPGTGGTSPSGSGASTPKMKSKSNNSVSKQRRAEKGSSDEFSPSRRGSRTPIMSPYASAEEDISASEEILENTKLEDEPDIYPPSPSLPVTTRPRPSPDVSSSRKRFQLDSSGIGSEEMSGEGSRGSSPAGSYS